MYSSHAGISRVDRVERNIQEIMSEDKIYETWVPGSITGGYLTLDVGTRREGGRAASLHRALQKGPLI